eukprot:1150449-Pelagomonas_calceolata.AAC.1
MIRENKIGSKNTPYTNLGKGNTLAERAVSLPRQRVRGNFPLEASVGLVGFWQHAARAPEL